MVLRSFLTDENDWYWEGINDNEKYNFNPDLDSLLLKNYDLCLTGDGMSFLKDEHPAFFKQIIPRIVIFARVAPSQKVFLVSLDGQFSHSYIL